MSEETAAHYRDGCTLPRVHIALGGVDGADLQELFNCNGDVPIGVFLEWDQKEQHEAEEAQLKRKKEELVRLNNS